MLQDILERCKCNYRAQVSLVIIAEYRTHHSTQMVSVDFAAKSNSAAKSTKALLHTLMAESGPIKIQAFCFPITKLIIFFNEGAVEKNILNYYIACKRWLLAGRPEERRTRARLGQPTPPPNTNNNMLLFLKIKRMYKK